jgi:hypothetical protein
VLDTGVFFFQTKETAHARTSLVAFPVQNPAAKKGPLTPKAVIAARADPVLMGWMPPPDGIEVCQAGDVA